MTEKPPEKPPEKSPERSPETPTGAPSDPAAGLTAESVDRIGLIREAYRIEGISAAECRSIFLDWALRLPAGIDPAAAIGVLAARYATPGHPMTEVLAEALTAPARTGRRGGWRSRPR